MPKPTPSTIIPPPEINPENFVDAKGNPNPIDNPYFSLMSGTTYISQSQDGSEVTRFAVTHETVEILGVTCVVVVDTVTVNGQVVEITRDYFAQDDNGNVVCFGEDVLNFENGQVVNTAGTWRAGDPVDPNDPNSPIAQAGFIMLGETPPNGARRGRRV